MATELSNQVIARDVSDGQIVEGLAVASSIRQTYRTADLTALQAITGQVTGDFGYTIDNGYTYQWTGTDWAPTLYDTGWITLSSVGVFASGWSSTAIGGLPVASIRIKNNVAYIIGVFARNGAWSAGDTMFTFTDNRFFPFYRQDLAGRVGTSFASFRVSPDGVLATSTANGAAGQIVPHSAIYFVN